jgi:hypothetical protein
MMDAPRQAIYSNELDQSKVTWMNTLLGEACANEGIDFIDLTGVFKTDYALHQLKFEFYYDGHWNEYAHSLVASRLYQYLTKDK